LLLYRSIRALNRSDRRIAVDPDNELRTESPRAVEKVNMSRMKHVEATVSKYDLFHSFYAARLPTSLEERRPVPTKNLTIAMPTRAVTPILNRYGTISPYVPS